MIERTTPRLNGPLTARIRESRAEAYRLLDEVRTVRGKKIYPGPELSGRLNDYLADAADLGAQVIAERPDLAPQLLNSDEQVGFLLAAATMGEVASYCRSFPARGRGISVDDEKIKFFDDLANAAGRLEQHYDTPAAEPVVGERSADDLRRQLWVAEGAMDDANRAIETGTSEAGYDALGKACGQVLRLAVALGATEPQMEPEVKGLLDSALALGNVRGEVGFPIITGQSPVRSVDTADVARALDNAQAKLTSLDVQRTLAGRSAFIKG